MIDRENVINGLKTIIADDWMQRNADYYAIVCKDALALLETQEPRVLTLEELEDWDGAVFFEALETDMYYVLIETVEPSAGMKGAYVFLNVGHGEHYRRVWDGEHYGSIWRCWTERPTDVQREAIPWA